MPGGDYAGAERCSSCHADEAAAWRGSHHDLALQVATPETVLGDFNDSRFELNGVVTRFVTEGEALVVETEGADGKPGRFPVRYTFGVEPLQQYLLELPNGRIQSLGVAWDSRPAAAGGQRWFHVYGDEQIDSTDVLHWTRLSQNWETMCADCHSTGLVSEFNLETEQFATRWAEDDVACEACHGPAEQHLAWAQGGARGDDNGLLRQLDERAGISWQLNSATGNSTRSSPRVTDHEITACAPCHSRRMRLDEEPDLQAEFLDSYSPALIEEPLYFADGQIRDEVYVYGSFLQSRMHQSGVTCSDCHDPHSLELRAPGPAVCLQCHASATFATTEHQLHENDAANCIDCHMPATTYMQIDARNDHSFRVPRPDLSVAYGVPNACTRCHSDRPAEWAVQVLNDADRLPAAEAPPHWSEMLAASNRVDQAGMDTARSLALDASAPAIVRATAASRLRLADAPRSAELVAALQADPNALVRWGIARAMQASQPGFVAVHAPPMLNDPVRSVRLAAASALAALDPVLLPAGSYANVQAGLDEYIAVQRVNNERPESHVNIANVQRLQGRAEQAEQSYRTAIRLNPSFVPAYVNLADLLRLTDREQEAESILRQAIAVEPEQPALHHSLGLSLVRQQRVADALPELALAANSPEATPRFALVYAVALNSQGQTTDAIKVLETALGRFSDDPDLINAFREFSQQVR